MIDFNKIKIVQSNKGDLAVVNTKDIPFQVKRLFWITNVAKNGWRGGHAHKECHQFLIPVAGLITVTDDGGTLILDSKQGYYVPPMNWIDICFRSSGGILLVFASHEYDEQDYIRNYEDYLALLNNGNISDPC